MRIRPFLMKAAVTGIIGFQSIAIHCLAQELPATKIKPGTVFTIGKDFDRAHCTDKEDIRIVNGKEFPKEPSWESVEMVNGKPGCFGEIAVDLQRSCRVFSGSNQVQRERLLKAGTKCTLDTNQQEQSSFGSGSAIPFATNAELTLFFKEPECPTILCRRHALAPSSDPLSIGSLKYNLGEYFQFSYAEEGSGDAKIDADSARKQAGKSPRDSSKAGNSAAGKDHRRMR